MEARRVGVDARVDIERGRGTVLDQDALASLDLIINQKDSVLDKPVPLENLLQALELLKISRPFLWCQLNSVQLLNCILDPVIFIDEVLPRAKSKMNHSQPETRWLERRTDILRIQPNFVLSDVLEFVADLVLQSGDEMASVADEELLGVVDAVVG